MTESTLEYRKRRIEQGVGCADVGDLAGYLTRISMDAHSLRHGLADAVTHVFAGGVLPDGPGNDLPYPTDRVEQRLFEDLMGAGVMVTDPSLATALRQTMRLLEEAAQATHLARTLLEQAGDTNPARLDRTR